MALLTSDSLLDCFFIPDFIPSGSKMVFENSNAPISWTKDSTANDTTLRIINGSISSNLSNSGFSAVFSNRSFSYAVSPNPSGTVTVNYSPAGVGALNQVTLPSITVQPAVFGTIQHFHTYFATNSNTRRPGTQVRNWNFDTIVQGSGQSGTHNHPGTSIASVPHTHTHPGGTHSHPITDSAHNHTSSSFPVDFRVNYKDFIIATKS